METLEKQIQSIVSNQTSKTIEEIKFHKLQLERSNSWSAACFGLDALDAIANKVGKEKAEELGIKEDILNAARSFAKICGYNTHGN